jgi:hypothetical protein
MESEYKTAEVQHRLEQLELELNSVREAHQQSQQRVEELHANQESIVEQRCQDVQARLDEALVDLESTKGELASSGERVRQYCSARDAVFNFLQLTEPLYFRGRVRVRPQQHGSYAQKEQQVSTMWLWFPSEFHDVFQSSGGSPAVHPCP